MQQALSLTLGNDLREVGRASEAATSFLEALDLSPAIIYHASVAIEEVLSNVIRHGYEDTESHEIRFRLQVSGDVVELDVIDNGREFDPRSAPKVDIYAPLDERKAGGLGVHLLRVFASDIWYERSEGQNHLRVRLHPASQCGTSW